VTNALEPLLRLYGLFKAGNTAKMSLWNEFSVAEARAPFPTLPREVGAHYEVLVCRPPRRCALLLTLLVPPAFLLRGAELMMPSVLPPLPAFAAGALVAVRAAGYPAAVAVGEAGLVGAAEAASGGMRGRGMRLLHALSDALWAAAGRSTPNAGFGGDAVASLGWGCAESKRGRGLAGRARAGCAGTARRCRFCSCWRRAWGAPRSPRSATLWRTGTAGSAAGCPTSCSGASRRRRWPLARRRRRRHRRRPLAAPPRATSHCPPDTRVYVAFVEV
jgi:hypothetical protein